MARIHFLVVNAIGVTVYFVNPVILSVERFEAFSRYTVSATLLNNKQAIITGYYLK